MAPTNNALNGVVIGLLSSFGSALLLAIIFLAVYFFRYTQSGRIFLDRIGRPGEYDDEQAFAREEAEALESMDEMSRTEYLRAKGACCFFSRSSYHGGNISLTQSQHLYQPTLPSPCKPTYPSHNTSPSKKRASRHGNSSPN